MRSPQIVFIAAACLVGALSDPIIRASDDDAVGRRASTPPPSAPDWVRGKLDTHQPVWGRRDGLVFGIHPNDGVRRAPRGLIAIGYPVLDGGKHDLVNFIAIEPVVKGRRGFSELELSRLDEVRGKRIWASAKPDGVQTPTAVEPGTLTRSAAGVEHFEVVLRVERFDSAHVFLMVSQRSDRPDEIQLTVRAEPDSAAMEYCILTATMGNKVRTRLLWLKDEVVSADRLYPEYRDLGFAPHSVFPLRRLHRTAEGDVRVALTCDEKSPAEAVPFPGTRLWYYGGAKVTQYWRKPQGTFGDNLSAAVNARHVYWQSKQPIPGGIAFENFELREPFSDGQCFVFGITRRTPAGLGFRMPDP